MQQYDTIKYLTKASTGFLIVSAYDLLVDGKDFMNYSLYNGGTFALSIVISELSSDFISTFWNMNESSLQGMITRPLLTGLVYMYLYDYFVNQLSDRDFPKTNSNIFIMGSLFEVLTSYIQSPLSSLFGFKHF